MVNICAFPQNVALIRSVVSEENDDGCPRHGISSWLCQQSYKLKNVQFLLNWNVSNM